MIRSQNKMNNKFAALKPTDDIDDDSDSKNSDPQVKPIMGTDLSQDMPLKPFQSVAPGPDEHKLQFNYSFWYSKRSPGKQSIPYEASLKCCGVMASVEQFWSLYNHIVRPSDLSGHSDYLLFKEGIRPIWEDNANRAGGKWIIRLRKGLASRLWENLILAMLGEQFMVGEEICGAVISVRYQNSGYDFVSISVSESRSESDSDSTFGRQEDILSLWNRTNDPFTTNRIRDTIRRVLNLPPNTIMEYKLHNDSLKDNSSYRNTDVFMR